MIPNLPYGPHGERNLLDLYLPDAGSRPAPVVVCIHGGGWRGGDKERYRWMGEELTRRGFAAASITYRFSDQWKYPAALDDVQRAVRWLRSQAGRYGLNPRCFGAIGGSAGAHLASFLALADTRDNSDPALAGYSSRVQCVVDCYGPVDFPAMMASASAPIVEAFIGKPYPQAEALYREASPFHRVGANPPPFLIVHGTADLGTSQGQVPINQSERFAARLCAAGGEATFIPIECAPHGFSAKLDLPYAQEMWRAAVPFFEKHLANQRP